MLKIDKKIPIPRDTRGRKKGDIYQTLSKLKIGDSFFVSLTNYTSISSLQGTIHKIASRHGIEVTVRQATERRIKGIRTWRIK